MNDSPVLTAVANAVNENFVKQLPEGSNVAFDPATIMVIIELVLGLIEMFQDCRKDEDDAINIVNDPTRLQRLVLKMRVRRELGRRTFREIGNDLVDALLMTGKEVTVDDMTRLYEEV